MLSSGNPTGFRKRKQKHELAEKMAKILKSFLTSVKLVPEEVTGSFSSSGRRPRRHSGGLGGRWQRREEHSRRRRRYPTSETEFSR